jgi:hypothetical protein
MQQRLVLAALFGVVALLVALTLLGLRGSGATTPEPGRATGASSASSPSRAGSAAGPETEPWQATPQNTTALPPGTVPAWQVNPPPPDPSAPLPPPPREPANPAQHRPAMDNPGGVNSDRPERPVPGVE